MKKYIFFLVFAAFSTAEAQNRFDLNQDGSVNVGDVTTLVNVILGKIPSEETPEDITDVVIPVTELYNGDYTDGAINYSITSPITREVIVVGPKNDNIADVVIPKGVEINGKTYNVVAVGDKAFAEKQLKSIVLPKTIRSIGYEAFYMTDLRSVTLPTSIVSIEWCAFSDCYILKELFALRVNPLEYNCDENAFPYNSYHPKTVNSNIILHVPAGCADAYRSCEPWASFSTIIDDIK